MMTLNFGFLLQLALIILVLAAAVALIQLIIILLDVRQVTKKFRRLAGVLEMVDCFFDGDELKQFFKQCRRRCLGGVELVLRALGRWLDFSSRSKEKRSSKGR